MKRFTQPGMEVMIGEEKYLEWLVVSSSRDRFVRVLSSMERRTVDSMRLPQNNRRGWQESAHCWVSVAWTRDDIILSSGCRSLSPGTSPGLATGGAANSTSFTGST